VIVLAILDTHRATGAHVDNVLRNTIRHVGHDLGQMNGRVGIVADTE
jgi:hypothetical protein